MEIKQEYAVFASELHGSDTYFYTFINDPKRGVIRSNWYMFIPYHHRYTTKDEAIKVAEKLVADNVFKGEINVLTEFDYNKIISIGWDNKYKTNVFVVKVPIGEYIGYKFAKLIESDSLLDHEPEFKKGDKVYCLLHYDRIPNTFVYPSYECEVADIDIKNGEYVYAVYSAETYGLNGFYPRKVFMTRAEIVDNGGEFYRDKFNGMPRKQMLLYKGDKYRVYTLY